MMQTALVSGSTTSEPRPVEVRPFGIASLVAPGADRAGAGPLRSDLAAFVDAARQAFAESGARRRRADPGRRRCRRR